MVAVVVGFANFSSPQRGEEGAHCLSNGKVRGNRFLLSRTNTPSSSQASLGPLLLPHGAKEKRAHM